MFKEYSRLQLAIIMLLFFSLFVQAIIGVLHNSAAWDELCFVGAGKAIFSTGYMRYMLLADHPPLSYYLNSIPLMPLKFDEKIWQSNSCWQIGHDVLFKSSYDSNKILFISRFPFIILSIILAIYILKWSTELFGAKSGIMALFLYSFNPSIIAYSGLATADFTVAAMIFIAAYYFHNLIKNPSIKNLVLAGIFFGLAMLTKLTAVILLPLFLIIGIMAVYSSKIGLKLKNLIKNLLVIFLITFVLVMIFHKFQFGTLKDSLPPGYYSDKAREEIGKAPYFSDSLLYFYDNVPIPAPIYVGMVGNIFYLSLQEKEGFVFGKITHDVVWYFSLLAFILKTHLSLLLMLFLVFILRRKLPKKDILTNLTLILPIIFILLIFSNTSKLAGINHLLGIYPFLFVLTSNLINIRIERKNIFNAAAFVLLFSYLISALFTAPYYLSYVSVIGGGPSKAYKIIVGSNLDQGQDLLELKEYMAKNRIDKIKLSYWGSVDPKDYGINYEYLPSPYFQPWQNNYTHIVLNTKNIYEDCSERKGLIAISITNLQNVHLLNKTCYNWLKSYEPVHRIGYSIFVYDIK